MNDEQHGGVDGGTVTTGNADVDAVVAEVHALESRPLAEHAGVYESAHERLRRALDVTDPSA